MTITTNVPDLQEIHDYFVELAKKAGNMITGATPVANGADYKKNSTDVVTETDRAVEKMVSEALRAKYPDCKFMGEETYHPSNPLTDDPTFVVDPIDGTINFVHSFPSACISLGFAIRRVPVVGVVYNPFTDVLYSAVKGKGAFLNLTTPLPLKRGVHHHNNTRSDKASVSANADNDGKTNGDSAVEPLAGLRNALICVEWGSDRAGPNWTTKLRTFEQLGKSTDDGGAMVHSMRSMGSAALNLCAVAAGVLDLYWEGGCWAWDVCAGWAILAEAGGVVVGGNPGEWECEIDSRRYLAVRGSPGQKGQKEIIEEFWGHMQGTFDYET